MNQKILLAGGCSFTDKNFMSLDKTIPVEQRGGWEFWPEIMAKKLNLECVNVAKSGRGADFIFNEIVKQIIIYGDRIDTVAVLWSGADRIQFYVHNFVPIGEVYDKSPLEDCDPFSWMDDIGIGKVNKKYWNSSSFRKEVYYGMIENQLIKMVSLFKICKMRNIKLVMGQGVLFLDFICLEKMYKSGDLQKRAYITREEIFNYIIKNPLFQYLEKNKKYIIGWPFYETLGGSTFSHTTIKMEEYRISSRDNHPNKDAQQLFAKYFIERHNELYG